MADLKLQLACGSYDRIEPLKDGSVGPQGIELSVVTFDDPRELFDRVLHDGEFDLAEMSSADHIAMTSRRSSPFVALPIFTSRVFRHSFICYNARSGIRSPADLAARRIGVPAYGMSAAVWCRGLLRDDYAVDLNSVTWVEGSMDHPGSHGLKRADALSKSIRIESNTSQRSLSEMLAAGEIDATIGALMPTNFGVDPNIRRLFPKYRELERDYYLRTRLHPIMHLIVVRRVIYEKHPWIASSLFAAFSAAKRKALQRLFYTNAPKTMLPFLHAEVEETQALFGPDPWPDGIEANRATLAKATEYMLEDGLIEAAPALEEIFAPIA